MALQVSTWARIDGDTAMEYTVSRIDGSIEIQFGGRREGFNVDLVPQAARRLAETVSAAVRDYELAAPEDDDEDETGVAPVSPQGR